MVWSIFLSASRNFVSLAIRKCVQWRYEILLGEHHHDYNFDPLKPNFYIVKLWITGVYIILFLLIKHRLWVFVRTVLKSTNNVCFEQKCEKYQCFLSENFQFLEVKFSIYLNRRFFRNVSDGTFSDLTPDLVLLYDCRCEPKRIYNWDAREKKTNFPYSKLHNLDLPALTELSLHSEFIQSLNFPKGAYSTGKC